MYVKSITSEYLAQGGTRKDEVQKWADALRNAGADVVKNERAGWHGGAFWREEFPLMVAWAF